MRLVVVLLSGILLLAGAGCTQTYIQDQLAPIGGMALQGSPFTQALHAGYMARADAEYRGGDLSDTLRNAERARRAGTGEQVAPVSASAWGLSPADLAKAKAAEARLDAAFRAGGREKAAGSLARAQVAYDCMVVEACPQEQHEFNADCAGKFAAAMAEVEKALAMPQAAAAPAPEPGPEEPATVPPPQDYLVFFDFDKSNIRKDAGIMLDRLLAAVEELKVDRIQLTGYTDRAGAAAYNQRLSERRARAVRDYLVRKGVAPSGITMVGKGEADPRVPTPDGVREQENRRVEIHIE